MPPRGACEAAPSRPIGTAVSTKMRSPQMTGDADPRPGISTFQRTFFVSLHSVGGVADCETPLAYGPRHCGQKRSLAAIWSASLSGERCERRPPAGSGAASSPAARATRTPKHAAVPATRDALTRLLLAMSVISFSFSRAKPGRSSTDRRPCCGRSISTRRRASFLAPAP